MMIRALLVLLIAGTTLAVAAPKPRTPASARKAKKQSPKQPPVNASPSSFPALPAKPTLSDQDAAIVLRFFNHMVDVIAAAKGDCSAVAANLNLLMDRNKELVRLMRQANIDKFEFPKPVTNEIMQRFQTIMPTLTKCMSDPDVEDAFKRFEDNKPEPQIQ